MRIVVQKIKDAHLLLVGKEVDTHYANAIKSFIKKNQLTSHITYLGEKENVMEILLSCSIGVLSSKVEGLPLAVLEYGLAGLAVVLTDVGGNREIVEEGKAGILVPPSNPEKLAQSLIFLLESPQERIRLGECLRQRVRNNYALEFIIQRICNLYFTVLAEK